MNKIKKCVIPVAGNGTRFLPITKTISKTLLPLIDKPVIQYLIEEAIDANIKDILIVLGPNQDDVIDYFNMESKYIKNLGKDYPELQKLRELVKNVNIEFVMQKSPKGLADAVYQAKNFVNGEDFALILGDDFVLKTDDPDYGIGTICKYFEINEGYYLGVQEVPFENTYKYGIVKPKNAIANIFEVDSMVEKPKDNPPSNYACVGRYILKNDIFEAIEKIQIGVGNELQLTDAMNVAIKKEKFYAATFNGKRYDVGSKKEYVDAINAVAEKRRDL